MRCRWTRKSANNNSKWSAADRQLSGCLFVAGACFFLSKILVFKLLSHATWNLETGRRLWTSTRQYTTQTGSTHSYTNTTTALPENVRLVLQEYPSLALLTPADFRPAHRARTSTFPSTAYPGIRAVQQLAQFCTPPSRSPQHPQKSPGL